VEEQHAADDQQRPVPPDVDGVDRVDQRAAADDDALRRGLPIEIEAAFASARSTRPSVNARTPKYVR
jgi:hypothetical protein